jgi:hypothetical protein
VELQPEAPGGRLNPSCRIFEDSWIGPINEERDVSSRGNHFVQQFQPLWRDLNT